MPQSDQRCGARNCMLLFLRETTLCFCPVWSQARHPVTTTHAPAHRLCPFALFSPAIFLQTIPRSTVATLCTPPISWACVPFGPLQRVQISTVNSALPTTTFTLLPCMSHLSYCASFQSLETPNCLIISTRGRTQPGLVFSLYHCFPYNRAQALGVFFVWDISEFWKLW